MDPAGEKKSAREATKTLKEATRNEQRRKRKQLEFLVGVRLE